jgi:hypothetical protein
MRRVFFYLVWQHGNNTQRSKFNQVIYGPVTLCARVNVDRKIVKASLKEVVISRSRHHCCIVTAQGRGGDDDRLVAPPLFRKELAQPSVGGNAPRNDDTADPPPARGRIHPPHEYLQHPLLEPVRDFGPVGIRVLFQVIDDRCFYAAVRKPEIARFRQYFGKRDLPRDREPGQLLNGRSSRVSDIHEFSGNERTAPSRNGAYKCASR